MGGSDVFSNQGQGATFQVDARSKENIGQRRNPSLMSLCEEAVEKGKDMTLEKSKHVTQKTLRQADLNVFGDRNTLLNSNLGKADVDVCSQKSPDQSSFRKPKQNKSYC